MMKRATAILIAAIGLSYATAVVAQPLMLYRGSPRPPSEVFARGFISSGTNDNPVDHISGLSCLDPTVPSTQRSAYVALTDNVNDALLHDDYVYIITPDATAADGTATFDAEAGLRHLSTQWQVAGLNLRQQSAIDTLAVHEVTHGQHLSRRIPPEWIWRVAIYRRNAVTGAPELVRTEGNPNYAEPDAIGSRQMFSNDMIRAIQGTSPPPQFTYATAGNGTTASVCMASQRACDPAPPIGRIANSSAPLQCARDALVSPASRFGNALQVLMGD